MANKYNHLESEAKRRGYREENATYAYDANSSNPVYSIDTPPPTVSGKIHIGHIFSYTQAEVIARYKRMSGYNVFYPFGFDDNGLPTERLVEKEIGKKGSEMPRKDFIAECLRVTKGYREQFKDLRKSVGVSADRSLEYSTISPLVQRISQRSFLDLLSKKMIYKKNFPALRCTECQTSVAQAEVEDKDFDSTFYDLQFSLEDTTPIIIATTRPELLPACVAVFVNPEDERYKKIVGKDILTPLGKKVKILADEKVAIDKGTGAVMCCTYGDETDMYRVQTYHLPDCMVIDITGHLINTGDPELDGLTTRQGRKLIVEKLKAKGLVLKELPISHAVGCHERCGTPMEIIPTAQRFINVLDHKKKFLDNANTIKRYPEYMKKRYDERVENLKWDRCISRQRFYGIPIPVRYSKKTGEVILPDASQLPVDPINDKPKTLPEGHTMDDIIPEMDVLDTRATSSLTPLINAKWGEPDDRSDKIFPMNLRPQAHDILRTRAFYTIVKGQYHMDQIPRTDVMVSGHVLASKGEKISKSKNNAGKEPADLIKEHSADAVRYRSCSASLGKNTAFEEGEIQNGKKLVTKLRNASNFVFMNLQDFDPGKPRAGQKITLTEDALCPIDLWIFAQANKTSQEMVKHLNNYEFGLARIEFEKFFRHDFCDNYLEIVKDKIYKAEKYPNGTAEKLSAQYTLYHTLFAIIKMIAPILPFITEELYQTYYSQTLGEKSVHTLAYPNNDIFTMKQSMEPIYKRMESIFQIIEKVRGYKTENKLGLGTELKELTISGEKELINGLKSFTNDLKSVTRSNEIVFQESDVFNVEIKI
ncbi:MAG: valine--tRNA ligase [candidate division SR1 bacterium]|nr:valine--tRNA ligase [candidate division SR1 bacterium]